MKKHIILAEIVAAILVAAIFAVVCGRARADLDAPTFETPPAETVTAADA